MVQQQVGRQVILHSSVCLVCVYETMSEIEGEGEREAYVRILKHVEDSIQLNSLILCHTHQIHTENEQLTRLNVELGQENMRLNTRSFWRSPEYWIGAGIGCMLWALIYFMYR